MDPTDTQMPMGMAAQMPINTDDILGNVPQQRSAPEASPEAAEGLMQGPGGEVAGMPSPGAPNEPPFDVQLQPDGSSIYVTKTQPPIVIGVNRPPKIPRGMQN